MSKFEEVCLLSCEKWIDSFPEDIPKHEFSEKHKKRMEPLLAYQPKGSKRRISGKFIKFIIIAAIIAAIAATALANPVSRKYIIERFSDHSEYNVIDTKNTEKVESLALNYIPTGFAESEEYKSESYFIEVYNNGDEYFSVKKYTLDTTIGYDTEFYEPETLIINGADAIYYQSTEILSGIVFNNGNYIFLIEGNIGKEELVKIAQNVE